MKMTTNGNLATLLKNKKLNKQVTDAYRKTAYQIGRTLRDWLLQDMKKPKSGREYPVYFGVRGRLKKPKLKRASAESETPAIRTGEFRKSINFIVRGNRTLEWGSGKDSFAIKYSKALEFGSKNMKARMPLQRSMQANEGRIKALAISNIEKVIYDR
jgi:hypothetical protein